MNVRPLPPQLTWVCPLVRFACFHAVSAPRHLLPELFSSTVSACSVFVCGQNCGQKHYSRLFPRDLPGTAGVPDFSFSLKIRKWSPLWSPALLCIYRRAILNPFVTQTVVRIKAHKISFCDAVDKEKEFENSGCDFESGLQFRAHIIGYNATKTKAMLPIFQSDLPSCSREILQGDTRSRHLLY